MKRVMIFSILIIVPAMLFALFWAARPASSAPLDQEITGVGAAWYDPDWHYRRPVTVTNSGAAIAANYQVLVKLDDTNFNFSLAKSDGTDLHATAGDGVTLLPFWIESWSSSLAYVWVKLPSVPVGSAVAAYLYFGNAAAVSASNGTQTFDLFEDTWRICTGGIGTCNPVHQAGQSWWETTVSYPMVFEDTTLVDRPRYHMLYDGHNVIGHAKGYAYSADLYNWTEYDAGGTHPPNANPIMASPVGYPGAGNAYAWGDATKVGSTYYMFASRGPGTTVLITSTNLTAWTGFLPLTEDDPGGSIATGAAVLKEGDGITPVIVDGKYWMVYFRANEPGSMYMAYSTDLLNWSYTASFVLSPTSGSWDQGGLWTPSFARIDGNYYIYYQGDALISGEQWETGYATAAAYSGENPLLPDSVTWTKSATAVITRGAAGSWDSTYVIDPMIRKFSNGIYYVFYTGNVANGYATATSATGPWTKVPVTLRWTTLGAVTSPGGILTLANGGNGISAASFLYQAVGYRANFGSGTAATNMWGGFITGSAGVRTMIGTNRLALDVNIYLRNYVSTERLDLLGAFQSSYHVYEILWRSGMARGKVDHGLATVNQPLDVPTVVLPVTFYNFNNGANPLRVDWVFVRQYRDPEPTTSVRDYSDAQETMAVNSGPNDFDWVRAGMYITTTGTLTSVQIVLYQHSHPNATLPIQTGRYWDIIPNTGADNYELSLTLLHARIPDENDNLCFYDGIDWDCDATSFDPAQDTITRSGLDHLSEWAVEENAPTAIDLVELKAFTKKNTLWLAGFVIGLTGAVGAGALWYFRVKRKG